ncbi:MAG: hypothetical protein IPK19_39680 [Chloroflexi bacterium]|nr:hypothetical protein [Chloroflexota bacterium]
MTLRRNFAFLIILGALALPLSISAQGQFGGMSVPAPSLSGGASGGPGMSGAALQAGGQTPPINRPSPSSAPQVNMQMPTGVSLPDGSVQFPDGSIQRADGGVKLPDGGQIDPAQIAGSLSEHAVNRFTLSGSEAGGQDSGLQGRLGGRNGERPPLDTSAFSGGFAPFSGEGDGLQGRFGGRGGESLPLESLVAESGFSGFEQMGQNAFLDALESELGALQGTVDVESAQAAVASAVDMASAAYDQLWADTYAAIDYNAQTYYDTMAASADYLLQTYIEAVNYTAQAATSYLTAYDKFLAYCALYPWDCYAYAYDAATGTYTYTGDASSAPVTTVNIGDVTINGAYPVEAAPAPSAEAYEALVRFAREQLGATVEPLYAGALHRRFPAGDGLFAGGNAGLRAESERRHGRLLLGIVAGRRRRGHGRRLHGQRGRLRGQWRYFERPALQRLGGCLRPADRRSHAGRCQRRASACDARLS